MAKTHFKKAFNSPYLGSQDLPDYKDINLTIERVVLQGSEGLKDNGNFNIAYFTDVKMKPMLLNATNSKRVAKLAKSVYIEDWNNIEVTLMVESGVKAFGGVHDALRIREVTRKVAASLPTLNNTSKKWSELVEKVFIGTERNIIAKYYDITDDVWNDLVQEGLSIEKEKNKAAMQKQISDAKIAKEKAESEAKQKADEKARTEEKIDGFLDGKE